MAAETNLLTALWQLAQSKTPVKLINSYKGMPIINESLIEEMTPQALVISTARYQISCLYHSRETFIAHDRLPGIIRAEVTKLNAIGQKVELADLRLANATIGKRTQVRVEPENPISVQIQIRNATAAIPATLKDLSTGGLGVLLDRRLFHPHLYQPGTEIEAAFTLPYQANPERVTQSQSTTSALTDRYGRDQIRGLGGTGSLPPTPKQSLTPPRALNGRIKVRGRIVKISPEPDTVDIRIGINLSYDENTRLVITQYISRRQTELIREINSLYEGLCRLNRPSA